MSEVGLRLVIVGAVVVLAVGFGLVLRSGRLARRRSVVLPGVGPGVFLFTGPGCASCDTVRATLEELGVQHSEIAAEHDRFPRAIDRVPTVAVLDGDGTGWALAGVPSVARLRRLLGGP